MSNSRLLADRLVTLGLVDWPYPVHATVGEVEAICAAAPFEALTCLLGVAIERGLVVVDSDSADAVMSAWAEAMAVAVRLDHTLIDVVRCLARKGLPSRALKGCAVATLDEFDPSWRSYGDVDVLVPEHSLLAAVAALEDLGLTAAVEPVGNQWAARFAKSITLRDSSGVQVDLHRLVAAGPFGARVGTSCLFDRGTEFEVGGTAVTALAAAHRLAHACYHAELGGLRGARHRRDVLLLAHRVTPHQLDERVGEGWSVTVIANALRWADDDLAVLPDAWNVWLGAQRDDRADVRLLEAYRGSFRDMALATLRAEPGVLAKIRYGRALVLPSRANLEARSESRLNHLWRTISRR